MNDFTPDDARLDQAEAHMRRALGLDRNARSTERVPQISKSGDLHQPTRRLFVRDGDVPVTVIHRDHRPDNEFTNQLDAARQAIRAQAAGKERAERLLEQAQTQTRDLQTKLAHERLAKDEAIHRGQSEKRTVENALETVRMEMAAEMTARERADQALRDAQGTIGNLTEKLHVTQQALTTVKGELVAERQQAQATTRKPITAPATDPAADGDAASQTVRRPRGRPRKQAVVETVEKFAKGAGGSVASDQDNVRKKIAGRHEKAEKPVRWW